VNRMSEYTRQEREMVAAAEECDERLDALIDVAYHEAGHAVAAIVTGFPIRYATLAPRSARAAGLVMHMPNSWRLTYSGRWEPELIVAASGLAAETLIVIRPDDPAERREAVRHSSVDITGMRALCRYAWHRTQGDYQGVPLQPALDPAWTVAEIAAHVWRRAMALLWEHLDAVHEVAEELVRSPRALTQTQIARFVAAAEAPLGVAPRTPRLLERLHGADLDFWPARYSRLAWRPSKTGGWCPTPVAAWANGGVE